MACLSNELLLFNACPWPQILLLLATAPIRLIANISMHFSNLQPDGAGI